MYKLIQISRKRIRELGVVAARKNDGRQFKLIKKLIFLPCLFALIHLANSLLAIVTLLQTEDVGSFNDILDISLPIRLFVVSLILNLQ